MATPRGWGGDLEVMARTESGSGSQPQLGYSGSPSGPKYERWREEFCRRVMTRDIVPLVDGPVQCDITAMPLPRVRMTGASGTPMQFIATKADPDLAHPSGGSFDDHREPCGFLRLCLDFVHRRLKPLRIVVQSSNRLR